MSEMYVLEMPCSEMFSAGKRPLLQECAGRYLPYKGVAISFCLKKVTQHGQLDEGKEEKIN
jgi:hypothetical protein